MRQNKERFLLLPRQQIGYAMKKNEEYVENRSRDWVLFLVSLAGTIALLIFIPEWVWIAFPFLFTSLAGAMGRL